MGCRSPEILISEVQILACARMKKEIYVLFATDRTEDDRMCRGIYDSEDSLKKGVDYWIDFDAHRNCPLTMSYELWELNKPEEPLEWEWAFIQTDDSITQLSAGGGSVPKREFWGKNLIGTKWFENEPSSG
jgi:hypothetical protein